MKKIIKPSHQLVTFELLSNLDNLSLCKATSSGGKVKEGDEFLIKKYQITSFETADGRIKKIPESMILGLLI